MSAPDDTAKAPRTVDLATFLTGLPEAERAEVREASSRIEALEREVGPPGWIERHFVPLTVVALALFVLGLAVLAGLIVGVGGVLGLGVVVLLAAFPALVLAYLLVVRGRTRLDHAKMALNEKHFLPHGGAYFGAGKVLLVERTGPKDTNLRERTQAQYEAATKRRWWW